MKLPNHFTSHTMKGYCFVLLLFASVLEISGHYKPYDPYGVYDSNDGYPQHFCELNEDEFGRPYLGPYDRYVHRPSVAPVVPSPQSFCSAAVREEPAPRIAHQVPPMKRRQAEWSWSGVPTPCITSDECNLKGRRCVGKGTVYDRCGRRCTCEDGTLTNCCRVRKEWRSMPQAERCLFIKTFVKASKHPDWKPCFDELIKRHGILFGSGIHTQPYFLPWHRWFILSLENLLRKIDCRVTVPYWDWSLESQVWTNSIVWKSECGFGGDGDQALNGSVKSGPFKQPEWKAPNGQILTREFNGVLPDCAVVAMTQRMGVSQFNTWHGRLQSNLHDAVHCNIGGTMCTSEAANDPIFFLHHGFVDKMWSDWQNHGAAFKNLAYYTQNADAMPGSEGTSPSSLYDLQNQPGCVSICLEHPSRPCCSNTTYSPICVQDMIRPSFSPLKLADIIHKPCPKTFQKAFDIFHYTLEERMLSNRYADLLSDYDTLVAVLRSNGYGAGASSRFQSDGFVDFGMHLYRPTIFDKETAQSDSPSKCIPFLYGEL
eukprot:Em0022g821a